MTGARPKYDYDRLVDRHVVVRAAQRAVDSLSPRAEARMLEEGASWVRLDRRSALALIDAVRELRAETTTPATTTEEDDGAQPEG